MVTDREAKVWMVAAMAVFVWACTMVGCAGSAPGPIAASGYAATLNPADANDVAWLTPAADDLAALPITITADTAADAWATPADSLGVSTASSLMMVELAPARPDLIRLNPRSMPSNFDMGLSGLSIAHPLLSAKRVLVAGVTLLHQLPQPVNDAVAFRIDRAKFETRPIAAAIAADQRAEIDAPRMDVPAELAGLVLEQPAWLILGDTTPTPPRPLPAPASAALAADEAKFDSAGIIGLVLGSLVLLFGGEAIVLLVLNRHQAAAKAKLRDALEDDDATAAEEGGEASIFRLPEPVADEAQEAPRSRAA